MFERFTGRARHVIVLAQEEARLLNHNYIGTEHLLLGLLGEPESIAGTVLESFGITRDIGRREVEERIGLGKKSQSGHIPFTPRAKKVLELSLREALGLGHNYIGTEHILLGLLREGDGVAAQIIRDRVDVPQLRAAVIEAVPAPVGGVGGEPGEGEETNAVLRWLQRRLSRHGASVPFRPEERGTRGTPAVEAALQQAARLAGPRPVGSHHLLLAALEDTNSAASAALAALGVDPDALREKLRSAKVIGTTDEELEQAGRRQMSIQVSDEMLTLVVTDPVLVQAGQQALKAAQAAAAATAEAAEASRKRVELQMNALRKEIDKRDSEARDALGKGREDLAQAALRNKGQLQSQYADLETQLASLQEQEEKLTAAAPGGEAAAEGSGGASVTSTVIRGDHPAAANLANVWLELRKTLSTLSAAGEGRAVKLARRPKPGELGEPEDPEEPGAATS